MCRRSGGREVVVAVGDVVVVVGEAQARLGRRESPSGVKAWGVFHGADREGATERCARK